LAGKQLSVVASTFFDYLQVAAVRLEAAGKVMA